MTPVLRLALLPVFSLCLGAAVAAARLAPQTPAPAGRAAQFPPGTGVVSGVVTAADSGRPLRRVRVALSNVEPSMSQGWTVTDAEGRFTFSSVRPGLLSLRASRTGYLEVIYGQKTPGSGRSGTAIPMADGQKITDLKLQMPRGAVISGVVLDDGGEPMNDVPMRALRFTLDHGERQLRTIGTATTNDRGEYRLAFLLPGEYLVVAAPRDQILDAARAADSIAERLSQVARQYPNSPEAARIAITPPPPPPPPFSLTEAFVASYYPGTNQIGSATPVSVDAGGERSGVDIRLQPVPIANIEGVVSWSGGKMPIGGNTGDTQVWLLEHGDIPGAAAYRIVHVPANGKFSFRTIPAGDYTLEAHAEVHTSPDGRDALTALWARAEIIVNGPAVSKTTLALEAGLPMSGRVVIEGAGAIDLTKLRVTAKYVGTMMGESMPPSGPVDAQGRFTIPTVPPGRYSVTVSGPGVVTKSSVVNGQDSLDVPFDVKPGEPIGGAVVTAIPRYAEVTGDISTPANVPVHGMTVIAFATDSRYWTPFSRRIVSARQSADGKFTLKGLPAGEYRIVAVTDVESGQWFDPAYLGQIAADPSAARVTLADGERKTQALRTVR